MNKLEKLRKIIVGKTRRRNIVIGVGIIVLLTAVVYGLRSKGVVKSQRTGEVKPAVDIVLVERSDMVKTITLTGQTVPVAQVDIVAKYTGKITQVNVELGEKVTQGQELIVQDMSDITIALAQNGASLRQANADAVESNATFEASYQKTQGDYQRNMTNYQRYQTLYQEGAISKESLDNAEQQLTAAKAALATWSKQMAGGSAATVLSKRAISDKAQSAVDALENQKNDLVLRAPRSGIIGFRQGEIGTMAQAGQKLLSIIDNSNIYIDCFVSEQDIGQISVGRETSVLIDSLGKSYEGKIIYVSPAMDGKTQTFSIRMALVNPDAIIKAGMFARTRIVVNVRPQTLFIPKEAVLSVNGSHRIFVVDSNSKVMERVVTLGLRNDDSVEIISGLTEGEQVAVTNLARLKTGVTIIPSIMVP